MGHGGTPTTEPKRDFSFNAFFGGSQLPHTDPKGLATLLTVWGMGGAGVVCVDKKITYKIN